MKTLKSNYLLSLLVLFSSHLAFTQDHSLEKHTSVVKYVSELDKGLSIKKIVIAPFADNVANIYANHLQELTGTTLSSRHQWDNENSKESLQQIEEILDSPKKLKTYLSQQNADALFFVRTKKTTTGVSFIFQMYLQHDGLLFLQEETKEASIFELDLVKAEYLKNLNLFLNKIPYSGLVLSRRGQQVTINIGTKHGLAAQAELQIIQILKLSRHPKLNFVVGNEKEILGKISITKADDYLSFGQIIFEKEPGVIQVNSKIAPFDGIHYPQPKFNSDGQELADLKNNQGSDYFFGKNPKEWLPVEPPQYGSFSLLGGFNQYSETATLVSAGAIEAKQNYAPTLRAELQLWLSPEWVANIHTQQSVFNTANSLSGSSPSSLTFMLSTYQINFGRNFLLTGDFFGPKIQVNGGIWRFTSKPDASSPTAFTTMNYGGMTLGVSGSFPVSEEVPIELGAEFNLFFFPSLNESPEDSGSAGAYSFNHFAFFYKQHINRRFNFVGNLAFDYYSSDFSGSASRVDPANSISHKMTTLLLGAEYLF